MGANSSMTEETSSSPLAVVSDCNERFKFGRWRSGDSGFAGDEEDNGCHCQDGKGVTVGDCVLSGLKEINDGIILGGFNPLIGPHREGGNYATFNGDGGAPYMVLRWYIAFSHHHIQYLQLYADPFVGAEMNPMYISMHPGGWGCPLLDPQPSALCRSVCGCSQTIFHSIGGQTFSSI
ncbi:hypothetical protein ACLOJK_019369 [Asimina triloba]